MRTYQLILKGGLTRTVEATGYCRDGRNLEFTREHGGTSSFDLDEVIMVEEILDLPLSLLAKSDRWGHRQFLPRFA